MKKKDKKMKEQKRQYDKGQVFVKIMAGVLAVLMIISAGMTLIYAVI